MRLLDSIIGSAVARLTAVVLVVNLLLWGVERLFGWSNDLRSMGGAALIVVGALFFIGGSGGQHLAERAKTRAITERDAKLYGEDRRKSFGAGVTLTIVGAVTLALAILFP